jgi:hypothetical protein
MKNKWLIGLGVLFVFGFFFTACNNGSSYDPLEGTWIAPQVSTEPEIKLVAANGSITVYDSVNNGEVMRGSYSYSGNTVTMKFILINTAMFGDNPGEWKTFAQLTDTQKANIGGGGTDTATVILTSNTFTSGIKTFTKQ